ncbi:MAG: bifunctional oligoribonuclease/PAP phosphatase NrnA [Chloroflexota bacterium]|nr:bifunctional oligoribonuclease/PAP phosphatase NrnA [Chloroflexota bacterium]
MTTTPDARRYNEVPQFAEATAAVDAAVTILLVTHLHPDGDAIGSLLGLAHALRARGKDRIVCAVDAGVPDYLAFIPAAATVLPGISAASGTFDLMISLDSSDEERTGAVGAYGRANSRQVINLDHHMTNTGFGNLHLVMASAVSATEVVMHWLDAMGQMIPTDSATALLTGLITDTIGFRVSSVTAATLGLAQRLMDAGAPLNLIMARTLGSKKYAVMQLWSRVMPAMILEDRIISAVVTLADIAAIGLPDMTDGGLVEFLVTANEAQIAVVFKEKADGKVEVGLRCKPGYDVGSVALALGGGGHKQASGATFDGTLAAARERVLPLLRATLDANTTAPV